jgi:prepilin-type processing-associated H-X9-DG protein
MKLLSRMPDVYKCPASHASDDETTYQVLIGPGTMFERDDGIKPSEITDKASETLLVMEASTAVEWTHPTDITYQPGVALSPFADHAGEWNALFADGSVRAIPSEKYDSDAIVVRNDKKTAEPKASTP